MPYDAYYRVENGRDRKFAAWRDYLSSMGDNFLEDPPIKGIVKQTTKSQDAFVLGALALGYRPLGANYDVVCDWVSNSLDINPKGDFIQPVKPKISWTEFRHFRKVDPRKTLEYKTLTGLFYGRRVACHQAADIIWDQYKRGNFKRKDS